MSKQIPQVATILTFHRTIVLGIDEPRDLFSMFFPNGSSALNSTEWQGFPARSCGTRRIRAVNQGIWEVQVEYRPPNFVSYVSDTRYEGWTALQPLRNSDGALVNEHGDVLKNDEAPCYQRFNLFKPIEFNDLDFGVLVDQKALAQQSVSYSDIMGVDSKTLSFDSSSSYVVTHRYRPHPNILITDRLRPGIQRQNELYLVDPNTPQIKQVVGECIYEIVRGFMEGRYSLTTITNDKYFMVDLSSIVVDATNENSRFECTSDFIPEGFLHDLAQKLSSRYAVNAAPVEGERIGFVLSPDDKVGSKDAVE